MITTTTTTKITIILILGIEIGFYNNYEKRISIFKFEAVSIT